MTSLQQYRENKWDVLVEGAITDLIRKHPILSTVVAGYAISKLRSRPPSSEVNVVTNTIKLYANSPIEKKLQQRIVDDLVSTGHYRVLYSRTVKGGRYMWAIRRTSR